MYKHLLFKYIDRNMDPQKSMQILGGCGGPPVIPWRQKQGIWIWLKDPAPTTNKVEQLLRMIPDIQFGFHMHMHMCIHTQVSTNINMFISPCAWVYTLIFCGPVSKSWTQLEVCKSDS